MIPSDTWLDVLQWHFVFALGDLSLISRRFAALISNNAGTLPRPVFTDVRLRPSCYDHRYYYRVTFDDEQRRIRKLGFQKDIYFETLDHLLRMIASSRIEGRLVLQNATVDRDFIDILHNHAHSIDIAGTLELRHVTYKPEGIVRELLGSAFRSVTKVWVYTATEELLEACLQRGLELRVDTMPALNIMTFCFGHPEFATRRCLTVRQAYTTSAFIEQLVQRHKRTPTNIEAELTIKTLPVQNAGRYAFIFDGPNGRLVHDGCALTITHLKGGGLHVKRGKSAKTASLSLA